MPIGYFNTTFHFSLYQIKRQALPLVSRFLCRTIMSELQILIHPNLKSNRVQHCIQVHLPCGLQNREAESEKWCESVKKCPVSVSEFLFLLPILLKNVSLRESLSGGWYQLQLLVIYFLSSKLTAMPIRPMVSVYIQLRLCLGFVWGWYSLCYLHLLSANKSAVKLQCIQSWRCQLI